MTSTTTTTTMPATTTATTTMPAATMAAASAIDPEQLDRFFVMLGARLDALDEAELPAALSRLVLLLVGRIGSVEGLDELVERAVS